MRSTRWTSPTRMTGRIAVATAVGVATALALGAVTGLAQPGKRAPTVSLKKVPTTSSPIVVSANDKLIWAVNPKGNGVVVMMREIDAPIRVGGKHWGGFRTAYKI